MTASLVRAGARNFLVHDNYLALPQHNCAHATRWPSAYRRLVPAAR
jgi:hypothetical protein